MEEDNRLHHVFQFVLIFAAYEFGRQNGGE
jgi:hypothetical protein